LDFCTPKKQKQHPSSSADPEIGKRLLDLALDRFGPLDVLVNNAGIFIAKPTDDHDVDEVEQSISASERGCVVRDGRCPGIERELGQVRSVASRFVEA